MHGNSHHKKIIKNSCCKNNLCEYLVRALIVFWSICDKEEVSEKYNLTIIYFLSTPSQGQYIFNASTTHDYLGVSQTYGDIGRTVTGVHTFCHYEKMFHRQQNMQSSIKSVRL